MVTLSNTKFHLFLETAKVLNAEAAKILFPVHTTLNKLKRYSKLLKKLFMAFKVGLSPSKKIVLFAWLKTL